MGIKFKTVTAVITAIINICIAALIFTSGADADENIVKAAFYILPNYQYTNKMGERYGYSYDYYSEIAQVSGISFRYEEGTMENLGRSVVNGEIDIINGVQKTELTERYFDFSDYPSSTEVNALFALKDDEVLTYGSYERFNGAKIGVIRSMSRNDQLEEYAQKNNFSYTALEFIDMETMEGALHNGTVDMIYAPAVDNANDFKVVARFDPVYTYFAVKKGNPLINKINDAMRDIRNTYPDFESELQSRYGSMNMGNGVPYFTDEELKYISRSTTVTVLYNATDAPIEYYKREKGGYLGITADLMKEIEEYSGLRFNYMKAENYKSVEEAIAMTGAEVIAAAAHDYSWASGNHVNITTPYLYAEVVEVSKRGSHIDTDAYITVALPRLKRYTQEMERDYKNWKIEYYDSAEECLDAVRSGTADAAYINSYTAKHFLTSPEYSSLADSQVSQYNDNLAIGVTEAADPLLLSILNKSLLSIPQNRVNNIISQNLIARDNDKLIVMLYSHPGINMIIVMFIGLAVMMYFVIRLQRARKLGAQIRNNLDELTLSNERFKVSLRHINCEVMEFDLYVQRLYLFDKNYGTRVELPVNDITEFKKIAGDYFYPSLIHLLPSLNDRIIEGESTVSMVLEGRNQITDTICYGKMNATAVYNSAGVPVQAMIIIEDITESVGEQKELHEKLNLALKSTYDEVFEVDISKNIVNILFSNMTKTKLNEVYSDYMEEFLSKYVQENKKEFVQKMFSVENMLKLINDDSKKSQYFECEVWNKDKGVYRHVSYSIVPETDNLVLVFKKDIDDQIREREQLLESSQKDSMTGLYNKNSFFDKCKKYMEESRDSACAVMFMDLDNFKTLNDTLGHIKGDEAIKEAASKLRMIFSNADIISRFGGDEFCVLVKNIPLEKLYDKLNFTVERMRKTYTEGGKSVGITASIGVAYAEADAGFEELLERADKSLYKAKEIGKDTFIMYTHDMKVKGYVGRRD